MRLWIAAVAVSAAALAFLGDALSARAQPPPTPQQIAEARRWFDTGRDRYQAGEWRAALESFERAYELTHSPEILFNIGQCADRLRLDREALTAFELYLERLPQAPDRSSVEARIRVLRAEVARADELERQRMEARRLAALPPSEGETRERDRQRDDGPGVLGQWWFWTLAVVVVGGGVAATLVLTHDPEPIPGSDGSVITTLVAP